MRARFALSIFSVLMAIAAQPHWRAAAQADRPQGVPSLAVTAEGKTVGETDTGKEGAWQSLMPKEGLGLWQITDFGTQGKVELRGDELLLDMGDPLTGVDLKDDVEFPKNDFEVELKCKRIQGSDFLCGLTFPVGDGYCSFIAGGWGGSLVGLSSINGMDASENATSSYFEFDNDKWYTFRVRVDDEFVRTWIDDKEFVRQDREGYTFSTRIEVSGSKPLGLCVYRSTVAVKDFRWRKVEPAKEQSAEQPRVEVRAEAALEIR
jgi:hypothetical protein